MTNQDGCDRRSAPVTTLSQAAPRQPHQLAEQLQRDATSLELTGASFTKDEVFYRAVAANVREAAAFLARWQQTINQLHIDQLSELQKARVEAMRESVVMAWTIRDAVRSGLGAARVWRQACRAIGEALQARLDSESQS